jgi:hypothetical protein
VGAPVEIRERHTIAHWRFLAVIREIDELELERPLGLLARRRGLEDRRGGQTHRPHLLRARNDHEQQQQMQQQRGAERPSEDRTVPLHASTLASSLPSRSLGDRQRSSYATPGLAAPRAGHRLSKCKDSSR